MNECEKCISFDPQLASRRFGLLCIRLIAQVEYLENGSGVMRRRGYSIRGPHSHVRFADDARGGRRATTGSGGE